MVAIVIRLNRKWGKWDMLESERVPWERYIRHGEDVNKEKAEKLLFDLLDLLEKHNIKYWEIDAIAQSIHSGYKVAMYKAIGQKMWTYQEGQHIEYFMENIDMDIIKKCDKNNFIF